MSQHEILNGIDFDKFYVDNVYFNFHFRLTSGLQELLCWYLLFSSVFATRNSIFYIQYRFTIKLLLYSYVIKIYETKRVQILHRGFIELESQYEPTR